MGRGRAKAKQTKVARELKYHSPNTDLAALQRELAGSAAKPAEDLDDELDEYDQYDDQDSEDEDEDPNWAVRRTR
jgi:hypothetical protein